LNDRSTGKAVSGADRRGTHCHRTASGRVGLSGAFAIALSEQCADMVAPGSCDVRFTVNPPLSFGLVAGSAQYALEFYVGVVQDTRSAPITLTSQ
jgi:hypothetical protein